MVQAALLLGQRTWLEIQFQVSVMEEAVIYRLQQNLIGDSQCRQLGSTAENYTAVQQLALGLLLGPGRKEVPDHQTSGNCVARTAP